MQAINEKIEGALGSLTKKVSILVHEAMGLGRSMANLEMKVNKMDVHTCLRLLRVSAGIRGQIVKEGVLSHGQVIQKTRRNW